MTCEDSVFLKYSSKHCEGSGALLHVDCCASVAKRERCYSLLLAYFNLYVLKGFNVAQAGFKLVG